MLGTRAASGRPSGRGAAVPRPRDSDGAPVRIINQVSALRNVLAWRFARGGARALAWQSVLIAFVCVAVDGLNGLINRPDFRAPVWLAAIVLVVLADAALALPARLSGRVALAHAVVQVLLGLAATFLAVRHGPGPHPVGVGEHVGALIAAYRAGAWLRRWPAFASLAVLLAGTVACRVLAHALAHPPGVVALALGATGSVVLPWLVGRYTTARRAYIDELRHRRENERRDARAAVEQAVAQERTAIARDLHDVISHHVSAVAMHAGAARLALTTRTPVPATGGTPPAGDDPVSGSLSAVEAASRAAMVDLRKMLDVLHGTTDGAGQPGLANLDELARVGPPVRLTVHGGAWPLPGALDVALYRMAQEMVTNACRHGDGSPADLEVRFADGTVTLAARNRVGPGAPLTAAGRELSGAGRGLAGIRTRAAMFGGTVRFGPDGAGRWETSVVVSTMEES